MTCTISLVLCYLFVATALGSLDPNWRLLWSDEFVGNSLDTTKWTARTEPGNYGNKEQQYYLPSQVSVTNGNLVITAVNSSHEGMSYVSGKVDSKDTYATTYGRYEVRAKVPAGIGLWPAIWMLSLPICWPEGVEIDIMEFKGHETKSVYGSYHYGTCCGCDEVLGSIYNSSTPLSDDFHVFAVEWSPYNIIWYFDNVAYWNTTSTDPSPHYIILNLAVGGSFAGFPDATTPFPSSFYVDYVRVYAWKTGCDDANVCAGNGCCFRQNVTCICDPGWTGSSCEYWAGTYESDFEHYDTHVDQLPSGWGNGYSLYLADNVNINNGLTLTISNLSCPAGCGGLGYSAGAWTSVQDYGYGTYSFVLKASNVPGTGVSLTAAALAPPLNQISFVITGATPKIVQLSTTVNATFEYQSEIKLDFDSSLDFHNYSVTYSRDSMVFMIDGKTVFTGTTYIPNTQLSFGIYYAAQPAWYGAPFNYTGNTSVVVREVQWKMTSTPLQCECVTGDAGSEGHVQYERNFTALDAQQDNLVNGWGNGFSLYLSPNAVIRSGLGLTIKACSDCGTMNYSSAGWSSTNYYPYGVFTFIAKSSNESGTALTLGAVGSGNGEEQIVFVLGGATPSTISATSWHLGVNYVQKTFEVPFDASMDFHNYSFVFRPNSIQYIVDNTVYFNATTGIPLGPLAFAVYYSAQPNWYGPFNYTGPMSVNISHVHFASIDICAAKLPPTVNSTSTSTSLASSSTTTTTTTKTTTTTSPSPTSTHSTAMSSTTSDVPIWTDSAASSISPLVSLALLVLFVCAV